MRVVIMGCGRVGGRLARLLAEEEHQVTVIDNDSRAFRRLGEGFSGETVLGTGIDEDVLIRAGIEQADVFVAATEGDNRNIMAAQIAQKLFQVPRVVARIYDPGRSAVYRDLGIKTYCPTLVGAQLLRDLIEEAS